MGFVAVYISDDLGPTVLGTPTGRPFATRDAAQRLADQMRSDLDPQRDAAGGGVGWVHVASIRPAADWTA